VAKNSVQEKVLRRCRVGDRDALRTAAYQLADELYAAAWEALGDDAAAQAAVVESWQHTLARLGCWRFGRSLSRRARAGLVRVLDRNPRPAQVRGAEQRPASVADQARLFPAPQELVEELIAAGNRMAPVLARALQRRRRWLRLAVAASVLVVGVFLGVGTGLYVRELSLHSPQLQFEMLQQRIAQGELQAVMRDAYLNLIDAEGGQAVQAQAYQRVGLVLEEITSARSLQETGRLQFVKERIAAQRLIEIVHSAATESSGKQRQRLMLVALALEEAANL